ncbi:hypothetical protein [Microvirga sp. G4-2]|uniref:hypothetical protein n=1 Tax=Microvirga sp. G4-2 TaxID=3434467 RepID=UPI004043FF65
MGARNLRIDQLRLDLLNPRIGSALDQHEAMQAIIDDQGVKLANLAENIIENNLNPMDRLLVMRHEDGKFIVLEGNRRTAALKVLSNPAVLTGLDVRPTLQKRLEGLAARFDRTSVEPIACFEVASRAEGNMWIEQRHRGEDEGRGIVGWSAEAVARFTGRDPALQALDLVRNHAILSEPQRQALLGKFPITTLDRLLSTPAVRRQIGLEIEDDSLLTKVPIAEALKPLKRIVLDLAEKRISVTQLKSVRQQTEYLSSFAAKEMPDFSLQFRAPVPVDRAGQEQAASKIQSNARPKPNKEQPKVPERLVIVPKGCRLNVNEETALSAFKELKALRLKSYPCAIVALMGSFIDVSLDHYIADHDLQLEAAYDSENWQDLRSLKLSLVLEHVQSAKGNSKLAGDFLSSMVDLGYIRTEDEDTYVSNQILTLSEDELTRAWDKAQALLEKIWP